MLHYLSHRSSWLVSVAFGVALAAQGEVKSAGASNVALTESRGSAAPVHFDVLDGTSLWALGATYKARFGTDGFIYVPFLGSTAPRNYPVQFRLRAVRVGGHALEFAATAAPQRDGMCVTFDRGRVREIYDLAADSIEQTFVVDSAMAGDVEVELDVVSELAEDATQAGLQFGNALGAVNYGTAYLVRGIEKEEITTRWSDGRLHLHVPASARGVGPVVIDPLISTTNLTATLMASDNPDVAYDATTDRFLATWVHVFSQADHDVVAELRTSDGTPVTGSFKLIDISGVSFTGPRVANLNALDRFLIGMDRLDPSGPTRVFGRTMDAQLPFANSALFPISAGSTLDQSGVDVGGDSGTGTRWMVVWVHGGSNIGAADLVGRLVNADGTVAGSDFLVEQLPHVCTSPQISLSNGNGLTPSPRWCVAYNQHATPVDRDVRVAMLGLRGEILGDDAVAALADDDLYPQVSSPLVDLGSQPRFLVSYERQVANTSEMVIRPVGAVGTPDLPEANLTRRFGFSGVFSRVDCDGIRFAATCKVGPTLSIGTLALGANEILLHESLVGISSGDAPHVASKRSGGGPAGAYGFVYLTGSPARSRFGVYEGRAPGTGIVRRDTDCGLSLSIDGVPALAGIVTVNVFHEASEVAGVLFGLPLATASLCGTCRLGVDLAQPTLMLPAAAAVRMPVHPFFVGTRLAVQGFAIGNGPCAAMGRLRTSDTFDLTLL